MLNLQRPTKEQARENSGKREGRREPRGVLLERLRTGENEGEYA